MFDNENTWLLVDYAGRSVRLTGERRGHILDHPEMVGQEGRIAKTLRQPDVVIASVKDESVHLYQKLYSQTPVTRKYLLVAVKVLKGDAFIITAFFTDKQKKGRQLWP